MNPFASLMNQFQAPVQGPMQPPVQGPMQPPAQGAAMQGAAAAQQPPLDIMKAYEQRLADLRRTQDQALTRENISRMLIDAGAAGFQAASQPGGTVGGALSAGMVGAGQGHVKRQDKNKADAERTMDKLHTLRTAADERQYRRGRDEKGDTWRERMHEYKVGRHGVEDQRYSDQVSRQERYRGEDRQNALSDRETEWGRADAVAARNTATATASAQIERDNELTDAMRKDAKEIFDTLIGVSNYGHPNYDRFHEDPAAAAAEAMRQARALHGGGANREMAEQLRRLEELGNSLRGD